LIENGNIEGNAIPLAVAIIDAICDNQPLEIHWDKFYRFSPA